MIMCAINGGETADFYHRSTRVARKQHRCEECARTIAVGEKYEHASLFYDRWSAFKTCRHCMVSTGWLGHNCGGFLHGGVFDDIEEHTREYPELAFGLLRLAVGMKRKWKRFDTEGLMKMPVMPASISSIVVEETQ